MAAQFEPLSENIQDYEWALAQVRVVYFGACAQ